MARADGPVIVCPEYNHGYPGALKALLDTCLKEYIHKPAGVVGVSAGPFGVRRAIEALLPVLRELGLVTIFWDVNFAHVQSVFEEDGTVKDPIWHRRTAKFLSELPWMAAVLRHGREQVTLPEAPWNCPGCGAVMNRHAEKVVAPRTPAEAAAVDVGLEGALVAEFACPVCGTRRATLDPAAVKACPLPPPELNSNP